jgi:RHS repeat-associated protein
LTWQGKRLSTLSGNGTTASYTYNEQGVRTSKTINSAVTNYSYNGSLLMAQVTGSVKQLYSYDAAGQLVSVNYNGTEYYYMRNGQNDIVGLMDNAGAVVVSYSYDAWGKLLSVTGTLATTLGQDNPFRYRGYYYDTETELYYLQTRYYDAQVGRFTSSDE